MSRKRDIGHDGIQEEILRKLEDSSTQRQIDIGGGVVVNITQEDYGKWFIYSPFLALFWHLLHSLYYCTNLTIWSTASCSARGTTAIIGIYLCVWVVTTAEL